MIRAFIANLLFFLPVWAAASPQELVHAARAQVGVTLIYDPSYQRLACPRGAVPLARGVRVEDMLFAYRITGHYRYPRPAGASQPLRPRAVPTAPCCSEAST